MADVSLQLSLKNALDQIDERVTREASEGFMASRLIILMGMWEKGKAIAVNRGVNTASFNQLEKETGRDREDLKRWHDLYQQHPDREKYLTEVAQPKADAWAQKAIAKILKKGLPPGVDTPPLPSEKYRVIYADPPWKYSDAREALPEYGPAAVHYPLMATDDLCSLQVAGLADENAVLFVWATAPLLEQAFEVIEAWKFDYKASFVWDKVKHNYGHYNSVRHEFLLLCTKGTCLPDCKELHDSVISIPRTSEHSRKPEEFRTLIDRLYPTGHRIELFARGGVPEGWDSWGAEV